MARRNEAAAPLGDTDVAIIGGVVRNGGELGSLDLAAPRGPLRREAPSPLTQPDGAGG